MRYCVPYSSRFRYLKEVDEVILPYIGIATKDGFVAHVTNIFSKKQRIIVDLNSINEINDSYIEKILPAIKYLIAEGWNISILIKQGQEEGIENVPYFFANYPRNLEEVEAQIMAGATDIYVTESLGFYMKDLKAIKDKFGIQLRVIPNIAQCVPTARPYMSPMKKFWIRPEDTEIYEDYIDVFELMGGEDNSRLSVIYEVYKQQQWLGTLNDIILDFGKRDILIIPNTGMNPHFAEMRLNCGKACIYTSCNLCDEMGVLAQVFDQAGLEVIKPRKKKERTEEEKQEILNSIKETANESRINEDSNNSEPETNI